MKIALDPVTVKPITLQPSVLTVLFEKKLTASIINCLDAVADFAGRHPKKAARLDFLFVDLTSGKTTKIKGDGSMSYTLPVDRKVAALIQPVDMYGNPALIEGVPVWSVSDPGVLAITPSVDGLSVVVEPLGPLAVAQLKVEGDADLGTGVKTIVGLADVETVAGEAVAFNVQFGTPEPK